MNFKDSFKGAAVVMACEMLVLMVNNKLQKVPGKHERRL